MRTGSNRKEGGKKEEGGRKKEGNKKKGKKVVFANIGSLFLNLTDFLFHYQYCF